MKIGIDASCWTNTRGYGRFTRELVMAMIEVAPDEDEFILFADKHTAAMIPDSFRRTRLVKVSTKVPPATAASAHGNRMPGDLYRMSSAVSRNRPDVFFFPTVYTWFPLAPGLPSVVTIHDAIAERFPDIVVPGFRARTLWRLKCRLAILQASRILTVSEYARGDIARLHSIPPERISVAVEAPSATYRPTTTTESDSEAIAHGIDAQAGWFVYVGGMSPHKNVPLLVRAFARIASDSPVPPSLILIGPGAADVFHTDRMEIEREILAANVGSLVKWAGFLPDESLRRLMSGAIALMLPSQCEGFGLPAVEAAACGTAVIATTESPLPELLQGGGIFVPPGDEAALHAAMHVVLTDDDARMRMGREARKRAGELSWARAAREALRTIHSAA